MQSASLPVVDTGLSRYLREIRDFPMLPVEDEYMLARRWREHEDAAAAHQLVTSHLRLVAKIALGYRHYGLPVADLISEGNIGLMRAVKKFDPERGFRLATYAMWWIKAALNEFVLNSWSLVKMGSLSAQKKLFFNLRRVKAQLSIMDQGEMSPENVAAIAKELDVPADDVVAMNRRMSGRDSSLNVTVGQSAVEIQDLIADTCDGPEDSLAHYEELGKGRTLIGQALGQLDQREREIFTERRLTDDPPTLEELGVRYGVSRERVRQIEAKAFAKVQDFVTKGFLPKPMEGLALS
jgi:RNA polymerase sigma-32 factor